MSQTRRLAAILAADAAGYSRLIGSDEAGTLGRLRTIRAEVIDPAITTHHGRLVKTTGDGLLVEFGSVVDALRAANEIQAGMAERNAPVPQDERIEFRMGLNVGDVVVEDGDIFGDGVNVAARLEGLATPGGICVSAHVQEDAAGKVDLAFEDMGEQQLKNIARPVRVYRVRGHAVPTHAPPPALSQPLPLPDKPSIAVLPFQNMTGDPEQDYFVDGIVEEITTAISRLPWLFVISRNSSFTYKGRAVDVKQVARELGVRYVLEGSVRKAGSRVRITGQLIDTATGAHIWADRFDGALDDIFELQDEVASHVVGVIAPKLRSFEIERAARKPTSNLDAYDLYLRAIPQFWKWTPKSWGLAIDLLRHALTLDPSYAPAAGLFAWCRVAQMYIGDGISDEETAEGVGLARQAIATGQGDPEALAMGGWGVYCLAAERTSGLTAIERALALNANFAFAWNFYGWGQSFSNRPDRAIDALLRAERLSPLDPQRWAFYGGLALAHLVAGRHEEAVQWGNKARDEQPSDWTVVAFTAAACGHLDRAEAGRECVKRLGELRPDLTIVTLQAMCSPIILREVLHHLLEGLRKAGLPEE
jgi:adenylate cyclase